MSVYDDDSERLGEECDLCGRPFFLCDCDQDERMPEVTIEEDDDEDEAG